MRISLKNAVYDDCALIDSMQVRSFISLLQMYEDYDSSPAAESLDRIQQRFEQSFTDYYLIMAEDQTVGMLRVCNFGLNCRLSPICILPEYQGRGYAQMAITLMEKLYPEAMRWQLDTIAQEEKLCHLYEKMGYRKTGKTEQVKDDMNLIYYEKEMR
jgi:RimJ/RimL family protein N-acetyltransferase